MAIKFPKPNLEIGIIMSITKNKAFLYPNLNEVPRVRDMLNTSDTIVENISANIIISRVT